MKKGAVICIASCLLLSGRVVAQPTVNNVEQQLAWHLKHIQYWKFEFSPDDTVFKTPVNADDSIAGANKLLLNYLADVGSKQPAILQADFAGLNNSDLKIVTSDDKKLRIYSWDTHTGGSTIFYDIVAQYQTASGGVKTMVLNDISKYTGDGPDPGVGYTSITSINSSRKKYYLPMYAGTASSGNMLKGIHAYSIEGDKLADAPIFHAEYGPVSKLEYIYDHAANYDFKKMKEEYELHLDKQKLYVPEVANEKVTGNYMVYNFDGEKFVYDKNAK